MGGLRKGEGESRDIAADMVVWSEVKVDGVGVIRDDGEFGEGLESESGEGNTDGLWTCGGAGGEEDN